jgi:hypothetical protein
MAIRIDVHPVGENLTNMTRTLPTPVHVRPAYASYGRSPYVATFRKAPTDLDISHCSRHNPQHAGWPIRGSVPSFSPEPANEARGISQAPDDDQLLGLSGPYHRHAIDTFNTCSYGPTKWSLINTGGGYNLGGAGLPHTYSSTFPTSCPHFPLRAPSGLHLTKLQQLNQSVESKDPMATTCSFNHSAIYRSLHLRLAIPNDLSLAMRSQG